MIELKIIESKGLIKIARRLTGSRVVGIQLARAIHVHDFDYWDRQRRLKLNKWNHENIHYYQARELWFVGFYFLYFINWLINLVRFRDLRQAYKNIVFEKEAYYMEGVPDHIKQRKKFYWKKWVF